jgi:hypothetical protein
LITAELPILVARRLPSMEVGMKPMTRFCTVVLSFFAAVSLGCDPQQPTAPPVDLSLHKNHQEGNPDCALNGRGDARGPYDFLCAIEIPGNALTSSQKTWVEQSNGLFFVSDASNTGVDVIDIRTHLFVGRIGGMAGNVGTGGGTATTNGAGPNSFVSAPVLRRRGHDRDDHGWHGYGWGRDRVLFVSDGNATVHVVDMESRQIIKSISVANSDCDGGTETTHYCGRSNEIEFDPVHNIIAVSNPNPLAVAAPHAALPSYLTFISARWPYPVLSHITLSLGVEGQVWVPVLNRLLLPITGQAGGPFIHIINDRTRTSESVRTIDCTALIGTPSTAANNHRIFGNNLWGQLCGRPVRMNARTGAVLNVITQVGTGDESWLNRSDDNVPTFLVTGNDLRPGLPTTGQASLGIMNARTGEWLQNVVNIAGASPSAYENTDEIFTRALFAAGTDAQNRCVVKGRGCVVVFARTVIPGKHDHH